MSTVGIVVNPLAGKDIRRLVGNASPVSDSTKVGMVRRAIAGAHHGGARRVLVADDHHGLGRRALAGLELGGTEVLVFGEALSGDRLDTVAAAAHLAKQDAGAVVVFGGDGTSRDVVSGWHDVPLVPVSTGTNNVFPVAWDAAAAGTAAGLVATGAVGLADVSRRAKRVLVHLTSAGRPDVHDVAVVDAALVADRFVGSRAVWHPSTIRRVVAAVATPTASGLSSLAGQIEPVGRWEPAGATVDLGPGGRTVRLPLIPGSYASVAVATSRRLALGEPVHWTGPGVIALDGERSLVLLAGDRATVTVVGDGPHVIDVEAAMLAGVDARSFDIPGGRRGPAPDHQEEPGGD
ncbi:NAD(+)/NADH kinase [Desertimonas flava]|uniref:NAD(+)/NADH kinase n=1 Tax=Desertimonas flava TaxID=2064846 RepID=UPI000E3522D7|nr:NAD(+)/NADH kinase [Desertimonas flava]